MSKAIVIKNADFSANKLTTVEFDGSIPCTALVLNKNSISFDMATDTETLTATPTPANTTERVTWASNNTSVATVVNGVVTSIGAGNAVITATCGNQTATCSVSVVLDPAFVLVPGYNPERRGTTVNGATLGKRNVETDTLNVLAANTSDTTVYPFESKDGIDTGSWWFVPIVLPTGATGITITTPSGTTEMKSRILWFDNTTKETMNNKGSRVVEGHTSSSYDQSDYVTTITLAVPETTGINSFGGCLLMRNVSKTANVDHHEDIILSYTYN